MKPFGQYIVYNHIKNNPASGSAPLDWLINSQKFCFKMEKKFIYEHGIKWSPPKCHPNGFHSGKKPSHSQRPQGMKLESKKIEESKIKSSYSRKYMRMRSNTLKQPGN
ncbi:hypothetical protein VP01_5652g1 [Puccinia sorghi]|uniref:Uncharacterized protein n=1 Tax=Puccinia sorghi TaxID=27349 RepID=A0A0L6UIV3_9BASI|nr:hypothetical protein VP01_5652g1 [Puccinia sorghi]